MKVRFFKPEETDPERDRGIKVPYGAAKRQLASWRWYLILLVVASPIIYFAVNIGYSAAVVNAPAFVRQEQTTIRAQGNGYVTSVPIKPPVMVEKGQKIAQLNNRNLKTRKDELQKELADLKMIQADSGSGSNESIKQELENQLAHARQQKDYYQSRVSEMRSLVNQGAATKAELSAVQRDYQQALTRISELQQAIADDSRSSADKVTNARIRTIKAELSSINNELEEMDILSPKSGNITSISVSPGDQLTAGSEVAKLVPEDAESHIAAYLSPEDSDYARIGQQASVRMPNGKKYLAEVVEVPELAARVPRGEMTLFNDEQLAVLVKMKIVDRNKSVASMAHGLPVKARFLHSWEQDNSIASRFHEQVRELGNIGKRQWARLQKTIQNWWS